MGIEHRWNKRQAIDYNVLIKVRLHGLRQARIRDISSSGMFVELPAATPLSDNSHAELIFIHSVDQVSRILQVPALVVRTTPSGAGLMFMDASLKAFRPLLAQLLTEKKQAVQTSGAMLEQAYLDTLQRLANTMAQSSLSADAGISISLLDALHPIPRLPGSGSH